MADEERTTEIAGTQTPLPAVPAEAPAIAGLPEKYEVRREIGAGGMGSVYLAHDRMLDRPVAVKLLSETLSRDSNFVQRFQSEARTVARLNHPSIVQVYEFGAAGKRYFIAMEYIDGRSLAADLEAQGKFSEADTLAIVRRACVALSVAHAAGVIHRDVKPDNMMRTSKGEFKLVDLGLSKVMNDDYNKTGTGVAMGTPHYISPEQIRGDKVIDLRTDIYSLGATMYQLATNHLPFEGTSGPHVMSRHLRDPLPDPREHVPGLSEGFCRVLVKMMAKQPADRHRDTEELTQDLALVEQGHLPAVAANGVAMQAWTAPGANCAVLAPGLWTAEELGHLEGALAQSVGPMARVLVVRATQTGGTREEIVELLSRQIPAAAARKAFRDTFASRLRTPTPRTPTPQPATPRTPAAGSPARPTSGADPAAPEISPEAAEALRSLLADRIGPLAGVLVRRAVARGQGRDMLLTELADHVPAGPGRDAFVVAARRLLQSSGR